ncbi:MAG: hypothetical protein ACK54H_08960 [Phycisphaerales bacterium]
MNRVQSTLRYAPFILAMAAMPTPPAAFGQQVVTIRASIGDSISPTSGDISKRSMDYFCELLGLGEESMSAAISLHEGYIAERRTARADRQQEIQAVQKQAQDEEDDSIFMKKLPEITTRIESRLKDIETRFMNDLRLLCDASDAAERWSRVERARRRETVLRLGASSSAGLDLIDIVKELKLDAEEAVAIEPLTLEYESELDRALISKQKLLDEQASNGPKSLTEISIDIESIEKSRIAMQEAGAQVAAINASHARKIGGAMGETARTRFEQLIKERSYPRIYRESKISKDITASLGFSDLSDDQRKTIESIREQYSREVVTLNDAWAAAVRAQGAEGSDMAVSFGGSMGVLSMGDEPEEIARARKAKKDLDSTTREKLQSVLTSDQRERLPKDQEREPGQAIMIDGGTTIRVIGQPDSK